MRGETPSEEAAMQRPGVLALRLPALEVSLPLSPNRPSQYLEVTIGTAIMLRLAIADAEYTIRLIRSLIASNGHGLYPDPARQHLPQGTLTGLIVTDSLGRPAQMAWFRPRHSLYRASIQEDARDVRLVATANDPDAELEWRRNGLKWDFLVPGLTSAPTSVSPYGWTLLEVRVHSRAALATGEASGPLTYQIVVTKDMVCHPKCRDCDGPGPEDCLSCYPPLVRFGRKCLYSSCRVSGKFFHPDREECLDCDPTCVECEDESAQGCTSCPPSRFLLVLSELGVTGRCVVACPLGFSVQPTSQHCRRTPQGIRAERFFLRLALRISPEDFTGDTELLTGVLLVSAQILAVSPQDVRFYRWETAYDGMGIMYFLEVENPFLRWRVVQEELDIDRWFAMLPVPVDSVRVLAKEMVEPPPVPPEPEPFLQPWMWAVIGAGSAALVILYPMYRIYFLRKHFEKSNYRPNTKREAEFVEYILDSAPEKAINTMAKNAVEGVKKPGQ
mmetsp:Transcript_66126/g.132701  ORF Transcript_66126/g.132701 Transcript_66126/m.132701 type:complete len:501 (+) Transcript_66126:458-1960(+)